MPDFSRPEYASYREYTREVAVERIPQNGDYYVEFCGDYWKPIVKGPITAFGWRVSPWPDVEEYGCSFYWLPTLADWLEMLEAVYKMAEDESPAVTHARILRALADEIIRAAFDGPIEEAAARLYQAVKKG